MVKTGVIIVSYNGARHLEKLLPTILSQSINKLLYKVVVVDNGSSDNSLKILEGCSEVAVIPLDKNRGFAESNNIGIQYALENFKNIENLIFLNNDTSVSRNFVEVLEEGIKNHPDIASVQTKIVSMDKKTIDSVGILIDNSFSAINKGQGENDFGQYQKSAEIFGTTASAMMITRKALETIDLGKGEYFDNLYFAYNEDVDMALRLRLAGFLSRYIPGGEVQHIHSATGGNQSAFKSFYIHRNTIFNIIKNAPNDILVYTLICFIKRYINLIKNTKKENTAAYKLSKNIGMFAILWLVCHAWMSVVFHFPQLLRKRRMIQNRRIMKKDVLQQ